MIEDKKNKIKAKELVMNKYQNFRSLKDIRNMKDFDMTMKQFSYSLAGPSD